MGPVSLPGSKGSLEAERGREEGQCHEEEDVDEKHDKVLIAAWRRKLREDVDVGPVHGEDHILNGNDVLHQTEAQGQAQHHQHRQRLPPSNQLRQVEGVNQEAGEAEGEEDAEEEESRGPRAAVQCDDEGEGEAEDPQHTQEEEELGGEQFAFVGVLHLANEDQEGNHEGHRGHSPHASQRL